jgi:hypothetical protein
MMIIRSVVVVAVLVSLVGFSSPAHATFHLMQIEQVIAGVDGDTSAQAIQLRMRLNGQGGVSLGRLTVRDATGRNPVVLIDFTKDVVPELQGGRILIASAAFSAHTTPAAVPDFTLVNLIPTAYFAAGSLTYETNSGLVLWRLSWGDSAYRGSNRGLLRFNDADGEYGPPFAGPLPSTTKEALQFQGGASSKSTNNAANYDLTAGPAVFTNVSGQTFDLAP